MAGDGLPFGDRAAVGTGGGWLAHRADLATRYANEIRQFGIRLLIYGSRIRECVRTLQMANGDFGGGKTILEFGLKRPFRARDAAEKIQAERSVFGKGVTGEVRFGKKAETGDAAGAGEYVPDGFANGAKFQVGD